MDGARPDFPDYAIAMLSTEEQDLTKNIPGPSWILCIFSLWPLHFEPIQPEFSSSIEPALLIGHDCYKKFSAG
jgi:hypothetical protein